MTLGRLLAAWLPVAIWFTGAALLVRRVTTPEAGAPLTPWPWPRAAAQAAVEALLLTLLASLWFDTLGTGGWWLPVTLVGALVAIPGVSPARRPAAPLFLIDVLRYLGAGALLAWRLGG